MIALLFMDVFWPLIILGSFVFVVGGIVCILTMKISVLTYKEKKLCPDEKTLVRRRLRKIQWKMIVAQMGHIHWNQKDWEQTRRDRNSIRENPSLYTVGVISFLHTPIGADKTRIPLILMDENRVKLEKMGFQISECKTKAVYSGFTNKDLSNEEKKRFDRVHEKLIVSQWDLISKRMERCEIRTTTLFDAIGDYFTIPEKMIRYGIIDLSISLVGQRQSIIHKENEKNLCAMPLLVENRKRLEEMGFVITTDGTQAVYKTENDIPVVSPCETQFKKEEELND